MRDVGVYFLVYKVSCACICTYQKI